MGTGFYLNMILKQEELPIICGIVAEGANDLKVIVIDNVGNSTTFESQFLEVKIIIDIRLECQQNNLFFIVLWISLPSLAQSAR
jgi:hypothetical protein